MVKSSQTRHRDYARRHAEQAVALLGHALNVCDNPRLPYRYARDERTRFARLMDEIVDMIEEGAIVELPRVAAHLAAQKDGEFRRFMAATLAPVKRTKARRRRPAGSA